MTRADTSLRALESNYNILLCSLTKELFEKDFNLFNFKFKNQKLNMWSEENTIFLSCENESNL